MGVHAVTMLSGAVYSHNCTNRIFDVNRKKVRGSKVGKLDGTLPHPLAILRMPAKDYRVQYE